MLAELEARMRSCLHHKHTFIVAHRAVGHGPRELRLDVVLLMQLNTGGMHILRNGGQLGVADRVQSDRRLARAHTLLMLMAEAALLRSGTTEVTPMARVNATAVLFAGVAATHIRNMVGI